MKFEICQTYTLTLSPVEFRLVSSALRGTLRPDQLEAAKKLQTSMMEVKIAQTKELIRQTEILEQNLSEK